MKLEIIGAAPIRDALADIKKRLEAAQTAHNEPVAATLEDVLKVLAAALKDAANLELGDGIEVEAYAKAHKISPDGVYKRIKRNQVPAEKKHGRWVIQLVA